NKARPPTALLVASAALVSPRVVRNSDFDARVIVTMPTSVLPSNMYWHRWFAGRPVFISDRSRHRLLVYVQGGERRWTEGTSWRLGPRWVYRRMRAPEE